MLKTIENLPVCPGIYDPALVDMAERKRETNLYFVDEKGANVDREIVKCVRSLNCSYKLPVHSKTNGGCTWSHKARYPHYLFHFVFIINR